MCGHTPHSELILDLFKTFCFYSFCLHFKTLLTLLNFLSLNFYFKFVTFPLRLFLHPLSFGSSFFSPFIIFPLCAVAHLFFMWLYRRVVVVVVVGFEGSWPCSSRHSTRKAFSREAASGEPSTPHADQTLCATKPSQ